MATEQPLAGGGAMFHARGQLLSDVTTLVEVDGMQLVVSGDAHAARGVHDLETIEVK